MTTQVANSRVSVVDPATAPSPAKELFAVVKGKFGMVPNLLKTMAHSPAVLEGFLGLNAALAKGTLQARVREQIALLVSQQNGCEYCLSGHSLTGKLAGLKPEEIVAARHGQASDPHAQAVLTLTKNVLDRHGDVTDEQFEAARSAGVTDAELAEVVGNIAVMTLTNYLNELAHTDIDFPRVPLEVN